RFACHGGCPKDRFTTTPDGEPGLNYLCPSYKLFFDHVGHPMRAMAELLAAGDAPAEIMKTYARSDALRGRNEPCTCGRRRKGKNCHGAYCPVMHASPRGESCGAFTGAASSSTSSAPTCRGRRLRAATLGLAGPPLIGVQESAIATSQGQPSAVSAVPPR